MTIPAPPIDSPTGHIDIPEAPVTPAPAVIPTQQAEPSKQPAPTLPDPGFAPRAGY
ncbi:hypothetical protein [Nocardia sp. NPDC046763]|uniref:hypothetical protein n=1 Tax=Nocardia sp. NPDC046763 TaxID=3155256 RepID=UPI0033C3881F